MKKFIKLYRVKPDAFERNTDGKWQLKPDAKLYGYFGGNYRRDDQKHPYDVAPETVSSFDTYNNLLSQHRGRRYNATIYNTDGTIDVNNVRPKWRGYSALAYSKQDRDNYFSGWRMPTKYVSGKKPVYNNMGKFEKMDAPHLVKILGGTPPNIEESWRNPRDDLKDSIEEEFPFSTDPVGFLRNNIIQMNAHDYDGYDGQKFYTVPFIVYADEDDIVSLDDVINHDYEPFRDYFDEVHLKKIRDKMQPIGLYTDLFEEKYTIMQTKLYNKMNHIIDIEQQLHDTANTLYDNSNSVDELKDVLRRIRVLLRELYTCVTDDIISYDSPFKADDDTKNFLDYFKSKDPLAVKVVNVISKIKVQVDMLDSYVFNMLGITSAKDKDALRKFDDLRNNFALMYDDLIDLLKIFVATLDQIADNMPEALSKVDRKIYRGHDFDEDTLKAFIDEHFNYNDPDSYSDERIKDIVPVDINTLSDAHFKQILFDLADDINKRRSHNNICEACLGIGR